MYRHIVKRPFDIFCSVLTGVVLLPVILITVAAVKLSSKGPVLFKQKRVGLGRKHFEMLKFRTMRVDAPKDMPRDLLQDPYAFITPIGRFLRKFCLDEIPQLWNIIKGDMSIVGPRPSLWNQFDLIAERDKYGANDVRPGIASTIAFRGRDAVPVPLKAKYDGEYCESISFLQDMKILLLNVMVVLGAKGYHEGTQERHNDEVSP